MDSAIDQRRRDMKARILLSRGIHVGQCSAEEWLALALQAEATAKSMSPFDPARSYFIQQQADYTDAAALREHID